jgi:DNA-binding protein H-NS
MSRYRELLEQQKQLAAEIDAARREEAADAAKTCRELIELFDLSPQDVGFVKTQHIATKKAGKGERTFAAKTPRTPPPALYRDPESGNTWSGRGKPPRWLDVNDRDRFLIRDSEPNREAA